jgi:hypothetical protein
MAKLFVMDHTGHSTIEFDKLNPKQLRDAQEVFEKMLNEGGLAATRKAGETDYTTTKNFNEVQDETLLRPQLMGG